MGSSAVPVCCTRGHDCSWGALCLRERTHTHMCAAKARDCASACGDSLIVPEQLPVCCKELLRLASSGASYDLHACVLQIRRTRARGHSSARVRVCACVCVTLGARNRGSACSGFVFASTRMCHCLRVGGVMHVLMCAADLYKLLRCVTQCVRTLIVGLQRLCVIDCKHMCM